MKAAVYCGTRNIYQDMIPSMKSLLIHSDVEKIYFLIEDDEFPYELPPEVECINVSNQTYFRGDGPNFSSPWSYMILLRAAFTKIFPHLDTILSLDCDTIVNKNISSLWDIPLNDYYIAAVKEPKKSKGDKIYINTGVVLFNLKKIREDGKDDEVIADLNEYLRIYPEQDCFNDLFSGKILELPPDYNVNSYSKQIYNHKIIEHFAAVKNWQYYPIVEKYRHVQIQRNVLDMKGLDIIVPFYNNVVGLDKTLSSVVFNDLPDIQVTVVDDCSSVEYDDIKNAYPTVNFLRLEQNSGPGIARQYGIDHTHNNYIMFVDTGDYILSKYNLIEVLDTINNNDIPYRYLWRWLNAEHNTYSSDWNPLLHGWVFKREFLDMYKIKFSKRSPRSNEDFGFTESCNMIIKSLDQPDKYSVFKETPIYMYTYDPSSLTHSGNNLYIYKEHIKGLIVNIQHVIINSKMNRVPNELIVDMIAVEMIELYRWFLLCGNKHPELLAENWNYLRAYYLNVYMPYSKIADNIVQKYYNKEKSNLLKLVSKTIPNVDLNKFLTSLRTSEDLPRYL